MSESSVSPPLIAPLQIVVFQLDELTLALPLPAVERVVRMVETTSLPAAPLGVSGVIDAGGEILPVFDLRARLQRGARAYRATDALIVAHTARRRVALPVDRVQGLQTVPPNAFEPAISFLPNLPHVAGVVRVPDRDLILIQDLDRFLSLSEEAELTAALESHES